MDMTEFEDILNNSTAYMADGIGEFFIDGVSYSGYGDYVFVWEKTYVKSPERSKDGSMGNLDTYATFVTPRMKAIYPIMPISVYRTMMKQYLNKNADGEFENKNKFTVKCYDTVYDEEITMEMYFATPAEPKYVYRVEEDKKVSIIGVENYTIELIGTNNDNK